MPETSKDQPDPKPEEKAPSLEDVYAEFNITSPSQQTPTAQSIPPPVAPPESIPTSVPDPLTDSEGFRQYQAKENAALRQMVTELAGKQTEADKATAMASEEKDLSTAVDALHEKMPGVNKRLVKYALADRYLNDQKFKATWDNRASNQRALNKVLNALVPELQEEFTIDRDPQLAENQRAFDEATRSATSSANTGREEKDQKLVNLSGNEFDAEMARIRGGGKV